MLDRWTATTVTSTSSTTSGSTAPAWQAYSGAFFDMNTNDRRPEGWTSADAAGLAILPGLVRYDEVYGADAARSATRSASRCGTPTGYVYPASHQAGFQDPPARFRWAARLRLKAGDGHLRASIRRSRRSSGR